MRGDGFIFLRGRTWWYGYYLGGKLCRESLGVKAPAVDAEEAWAKSRSAAEAAAKRIRDGILTGRLLPRAERRTTVADLLEDLEVHLRNKERAYLPKAIAHMKALRTAIGHIRADELDTVTIERYHLERRQAGRAPATVNRECELLRQAYRLAARRRPPRVASIPLIPLLPVENARQGFVSFADFDAALRAIRDEDLRDYYEWFWWTGMRPAEIRRLTWQMLNRETWTLHLDPRASKTRRGRVIPLLTPAGARTPLYEIVERRIARRLLESPLIFHRKSRGRPGWPVSDDVARAAFREAVAAAKLAPGLRPYDLRRTAVRNLVRGGTDYTVAMRISGHRTRSTFDRYNIVSEDDVAAAIERTVAYVEQLPRERNVVRAPAAPPAGATRARAGHGRAGTRRGRTP